MHAHAIVRGICVINISLVLIAPVARGQIYEERPGRREFTGEMIIRPLQVQHWMERGFTREEAEALHRETTEWLVDFLGDRVLSHHPRMDRYLFELRQNENENEMGALLLERGGFRYVCPNWRYFTQGNSMWDNCTTDTNLSSQWHHTVMESCAGWQIHTAGHDDVVVTLIDVGLRKTHEDLDNAYRQEAYNSGEELWESEGGTISDASSHGTHVNGCAAATGNNSKGCTPVQGCSGLNVDIDSAQVLGTATAGSNGAAILAQSVPSEWSNQTVYIQCVEIANCRKSNRVQFTFP